jgi:hypothetical protein
LGTRNLSTQFAEGFLVADFKETNRIFKPNLAGLKKVIDAIYLRNTLMLRSRLQLNLILGLDLQNIVNDR